MAEGPVTTARSVTRKLLDAHFIEGSLDPGGAVALRIDQTLTQDATGTLVMLELEALGLTRAQTEVSAQYVDHNLLQTDFRNDDDHVFLHSACRRFGLWFSRPGNGVSHPLHMQAFGRPGASLLGSDSHTCAGGALGMLAIGAGSAEVALAIAGEPFHVTAPAVWAVRLDGELPPWVVLPLVFEPADDAAPAPETGDRLRIEGVHAALDGGAPSLRARLAGRTLDLRCKLDERAREVVRAGGLIAWSRKRRHRSAPRRAPLPQHTEPRRMT